MKTRQCPDGWWVDEAGCRDGRDRAAEIMERRPKSGRDFICFSCPRLAEAEETKGDLCKGLKGGFVKLATLEKFLEFMELVTPDELAELLDFYLSEDVLAAFLDRLREKILH